MNKVTIELNDPRPEIEQGNQVIEIIKKLEALGFEVSVKINGSTMSMASIIHKSGKK